MTASLEQLRDLSVTEKLQIVEQLWDDISDAEIPAIVQDWHKAEVHRRKHELMADPSAALTRAELWQRTPGEELNCDDDRLTPHCGSAG